MLERLGDAALLGVHAPVLRRHAVEDAGQALGLLSSPGEPIGHEHGGQRNQHAGDGDDPRQVLEEGAAERSAWSDDDRECAGAERHHARGLPARERQPLLAGHQDVAGAPRVPQVERVLQVRESAVSLERRPPVSGERVFRIHGKPPRMPGYPVRKTDARVCRAQEPGDVHHPRTVGAAQELGRPGRRGCQLGSRAQHGGRSSARCAHGPQRHRRELAAAADVGRHEGAELLPAAAGRIRQRRRRCQRRLNRRGRGLHDEAELADAQVQHAALVAVVDG